MENEIVLTLDGAHPEEIKVPESVIENCKENFDMMLEFSNSDKMEDILWRDENE